MPELAATGADFVSVGALTHSAPAVDISFELEPLLDLSPDVAGCRCPDDLAERARDRARPRFGRLGVRAVVYFPVDRIDQRRRAGARRRERRRAKAPSSSPTSSTPAAAAAATTWFSPPGSGLYVSVVVDAGRARVDPARATHAADAGGRRRARRRRSRRRPGSRVELKWPNDLLRRPRESSPAFWRRRRAASRRRRPSSSATASTSSAAAYPPELRDRATSLETELGAAGRSRARSRRDARRAWRAATTICSPAASMLFSTPGARARRRASAPASRGTSARPGIGRDGRHRRARRAAGAVGERIERIVAGEIHWL